MHGTIKQHSLFEMWIIVTYWRARDVDLYLQKFICDAMSSLPSFFFSLFFPIVHIRTSFCHHFTLTIDDTICCMDWGMGIGCG